MRTPLRIAANLVSVVALALILLLPSSKYEWIETADPSFSASNFEDAGGNHMVVVSLLMVLVLGAQLLLLVCASEKRHRQTAAVFMLVAVVVGLTKLTL